MSDALIERRHVLASVGIAAVMATIFASISSGLSLVVTFETGVVFALGLVVWMSIRRVPLPEPGPFLALYLVALSVQFLHFFEEYVTGFNVRFPAAYGGSAYPLTLFVGFNMIAYALMTLASVAVYLRGVRAALMPSMFFVVYGVLGNAVSHPLWAIHERGYFPGLFSALAYVVLGPMLVQQLLRNRKHTAAFIGSFALFLVLVQEWALRTP